MKKNYEKSQLLFSITFLFIIVTLVFIIFLYKYDYKVYKKVSATVITNNYISIYVDDYMLKCLKSNHKFYIKNKIYEYEITDITKKVVKNKNKWYHEVILKVESLKKYKDRDIITISIYCRRNNLITIFKNCWKE